jgi:toxin ParE1/3/4
LSTSAEPPRRSRFRQFQDDLESIASYYLGEAGIDVAVRSLREVEDLVELLRTNRGFGSTRYSDLGVPGLRSVAMARSPYVVFFGRRSDRVLFWRIVHGSRDIPETLRESDSSALTDE